MPTSHKVIPLVHSRSNARGIYFSSLTGAYYDTRSYPNRQQRLRPVDVSAFSLSNTGRVYYTHFKHTVAPYAYHIWNGDLYTYSCVSMVSTPGLGYPGDIIQGPDTLTKLRLAIRQSTASLGMALAQYRQTARLFHGVCTFARRAYALRRRFVELLMRYRKRMRSWRKNPRGPKPRPPRPPRGAAASDVYLAYVFGLKPLINDLIGSADVLLDRLREPVWLPFNVSASSHGLQQTTAGNHLNQATIQVIRQRRISRRKAIIRLSGNDLHDLKRLGFSNPLEVVWDAIPFSFIVNAIIPIGTWLKSLDAMVGVAEIRHYQTTKNIIATQLELMGRYPTYTWEQLHRSGVSVGLPHAPFPTYKPSRALGMVLSGIALLDQIRRNRDYRRTFAVLGR